MKKIQTLVSRSTVKIMDFDQLRCQGDFEQAYRKLERQQKSLWRPLSQEGVLLKLIIGAFALYVGLMVVNLLNTPVLTLLYTVCVVGTVWYGLDLLRRQLTTYRRRIAQQQQQLFQTAQRFLTKIHLDALDSNAHLVKHYGLDAAKSLLPYIWGVSPEQWRQHNHFEWEGITVASLSMEQEGQAPFYYWLLGTPVSLPLEAESTAFLPRPFAHDRWTPIHYNAAIETPEFRANYQIYTSEFWHSYYVTRAALVRQFLAQAQGQVAYLVVRKGWLYWAFPQSKEGTATTVADWKELSNQVKQQLTTGYGLAKQVQVMRTYLKQNS